MKYFEQYVSNTCAGSGNQLYFTMKEDEVHTGRVFYKIMAAGEFNYSLLFSNILDSTYSIGNVGHKNLICDSWSILGARIGKCASMPMDKPVTELTMADGEDSIEADVTVTGFVPITFGGKAVKEVMPGEFFVSDPVLLTFEAGEFLCLEMTYSGPMIPYHEESMLAVFSKTDSGWVYGKKMPFAGMVGCDRKCVARIAYLGDSVTQGIGAPPNSYLHWNALLSDMLGNRYAYWNLGLGFGRGNDAASDGAWLYKAKQNDVVVVCYGVNDISKKFTEEQIKKDLTEIVDKLHDAGCKVVVQTIPPFDYDERELPIWLGVNHFIKTELTQKADMVFDVVPYLWEDEEHPQNAPYGGHPNIEGGRIWAEALYTPFKEFLDKLYN